MRSLTSSCLLASAMFILAASPAYAEAGLKEWAAIGRKPATTPAVAKGIERRISKLPVPANFKAQGQAVLRQALALEPAPQQRNDAVLERGGLDRAWISFTGQKGGKQVSKHVSVNRSTGGGNHSVGLTTQTTVVDSQGRGVQVWRRVKPILGGFAVEDMSLLRFARENGADSYRAGLGKTFVRYHLVGKDGKRLVELDQDQALGMSGLNVGGKNLMLASSDKSYAWDRGYDQRALTPEQASRLREIGVPVIERREPAYFLVTDSGEHLAPLTAQQAATLAAKGMTFSQAK
jgi:hypothetical protein